MELPIKICDNNWDGLIIDDAHHLENLQKIAEKPIGELSLDDNPNLLIFPQNLEEYGDKIGEQHVCEVDDNKLKTKNIMGFIGYGDTKLRIHSRFAQGDDDYFLHYMLQKVFSINLFDLKYHEDEESIFDFLIYLFPAFLKRAMQQGLYKEYQTRAYNDADIRGRIDVARHIRMNIPFAGKVSRGARFVQFVDNSRASLKLTGSNIQKCRAEADCKVLKHDAEAAVDLFSKQGQRFDLIFVDPPYNKGWVQKILKKLDSSPLLTENGWLIAEHSAHDDIAGATPEGYEVFRSQQYGETVLSFIKRKG